MKTLVSTLIITALLTTTAYADKREGKRGEKIEQAIASLQLEATQASNLKTLIESHRSDRKALRQQGNKNREQRQALKKQHRQALLDVLGYEKMYEFEGAMRENRSKKRRHKRNKS